MVEKKNMGIIIKSQIRPLIKELDKDNSITAVADEVGMALERKTEEILSEAIKRAKANGRKTVQSRDL